jgi:hypothetical protein
LVRVGRHGGGVAALYRGGSAGPSSRILVRDSLRTSVQWRPHHAPAPPSNWRR